MCKDMRLKIHALTGLLLVGSLYLAVEGCRPRPKAIAELAPSPRELLIAKTVNGETVQVAIPARPFKIIFYVFIDGNQGLFCEDISICDSDLSILGDLPRFPPAALMVLEGVWRQGMAGVYRVEMTP